MTDAVVTWNTVYVAAVIHQLRAAGKAMNEKDIALLSATGCEHINREANTASRLRRG